MFYNCENIEDLVLEEDISLIYSDDRAATATKIQKVKELQAFQCKLERNI